METFLWWFAFGAFCLWASIMLLGLFYAIESSIFNCRHIRSWRRKWYKEDVPRVFRWFPIYHRMSAYFDIGDIVQPEWSDDEWRVTNVDDRFSQVAIARITDSPVPYLTNFREFEWMDYEIGIIKLVQKAYKEFPYDPSQQKDEEDDI